MKLRSSRCVQVFLCVLSSFFFFLFLIADASAKVDECQAALKGGRKFRRIEARGVYRTLRDSRENEVALFATQWDGTADKIEKVVESAFANLTQSPEKGFLDDNLGELELLRYDVTYRDAKKLRDKYGLLFELPCTFYFRNKTSYVFSQSHTFESARFSLSRIRSMKDDGRFPLQRLDTRDQLSTTVDSREITFIFLDLPKQEEESVMGEAEDKGQGFAVVDKGEGEEEEEEEEGVEVDWDKLWEDVLNDEAYYEQISSSEKSLSAVGEAVSNTHEDVYNQFVELAGKNLLSPNVLFCYTNETDVLPKAGFVTDEETTSKENFLVYAFHGESVLDVFTPGCPCSFVSWLRSIVRTRNLVNTVTDAQFWDQLSEQVDIQRQWLVAQEERKLREKIQEARGPSDGSSEEGETAAENASTPTTTNTYEVEVVLLQSDQLSEEQARNSRDFKSFQIAAEKILLRKSNLVEVCSKSTETTCEEQEGSTGKEVDKASDVDDGGVTREYHFFHLPYTQDIWRGSLAAMLELVDFPCVMLFDTRHKLYYKLQPRNDLQGFSDPEEIIEFVHSHKQNALKPYIRSQVLDEDTAPLREEGDTSGGDSDGVIQSTNVMRFRQDTGMSKKRECKPGDLLSAVLFHVTYCSFCKRALGVFRQVKKLSHSYETLHKTKFLSMDCDRNDCYPSILNVTGTASFDKLPVIVFFPCKRAPVLYDGAFKVNNILTNILEIKGSSTWRAKLRDHDDVDVGAFEDSAAFLLQKQNLSSWMIFSGLLSVVLAALYVVWIDPDLVGVGTSYIDLLENTLSNPHLVMVGLLVIFGIAHSGLAALRPAGEDLVGKRAYRVAFALVSLPLAFSCVMYFINHRYSGVPLYNLQQVPGMHDLVWGLSFLSFFFLYPSTFNLLEVAAVDVPEVHLWETGVIRITRHPQMVGQIIWSLAHCLWIGNSFTLTTMLGLCGYHWFGSWHGDQRLKKKFGEDFKKLEERTSVWPFLAILDGRQELPKDYWKEFIKLPYLAVTCFTIGAYLCHPLMQRAAYWLDW